VWHDQDGKPLHLHTNYYEGSNTKFYGAALFRLRERDFGEIRHHGGIPPAWPITYGDLEPYYRKAEHLYEVHGTRTATDARLHAGPDGQALTRLLAQVRGSPAP